METDLWWMIPMMRHHIEGRSAAEIAAFVLSPWPINMGQPLLKGYLLLAVAGGWSMKALIGLAMGFHAANGLLLGGVGRLLGLSRPVAVSSALVYLTLFAHFHTYLWPTGSQHVVAVFTILGVLWLYLKTESLIRLKERVSWKWFYALAIGTGAVASLGRSALLTPILVLTHLLAASDGAQERFSRWRRWLPFLAVSMVYPAVTLGAVGDVIINDVVVRLPVSAWMKVAALLALGLSALAWLDRMLRPTPAGDRMRKRAKWFGLWAALPLAGGALLLADHRQFLFPYNALVPWTALWTSFLTPFESVLRVDSTEPYHYVLAQISLFSAGCSVLWAVLFLRGFIARNRALWLLPVWYGVCLIHLLHHYSSFPVRIPSRYFVYLSPVFAWIFCAVARRFYNLWTRQLGWKRQVRHGVWAVGLIGLCAANLAAVQLAVFRGRLVNTYFAYDDVRVVSLIGENMRSTGERPGRQDLYVQGVVPMPMRELWAEFMPETPSPYLHFKFLAAQALGSHQVDLFHVNEGPAKEGRIYTVAGVGVLDGSGQEIDWFSREVAAGWARLNRSDFEGAREALMRGVEIRPFLFRYLLPECRLSDVRWMTQGRGFREWLGELEWKYRGWSAVPLAKGERIREVMRQELLDYAVSLYVLSYLEDALGRHAWARAWLSQLYLLEPDPGEARAWLRSDERVGTHAPLLRYLEAFEDPQRFYDPLPWRKDDYGFGRFLVRLIFHRDIQSKWDKQFAPAI